MTRGRPKAGLVVTHGERAQLTSLARSRSLPGSLSARARIVLSSAERLELGKATMSKWRIRFIEPEQAADFGELMLRGVAARSLEAWIGQ